MLEAIKFTVEQKATYKAMFAPTATPDQFNFFIEECERRNLVPGTHVVFSLRPAKEYNRELRQNVDVLKVVLITTINALRLIAKRDGKFRGYGKFIYYYGAEGDSLKESIIPLGRIPHAVSAELLHADWQQPVFVVARYDAYAQTKNSDGKEVSTKMWRQRAEEQLAKCAEALGLRMIAPEECGGLYLEEEFASETKEDAAEKENAQPSAPVVVPQPTVAPPVNQTAAPIQVSEPAKLATPAPAPAPAAPSKPALPARPALPVKPAIPAPKPAAQSAAQPGPVPNRLPQEDQPVKESPKELAEFADRIARDNTPAKPFVATDADLPEILQAKTENPSHASTVVTTPIPAQTVAAESGTDAPMTQAEYKTLMDGTQKLVRDHLEKNGGLKNAGAVLKDYLLKKTGKAKIQNISAAQFTTLVDELKKLPPAEAAAKVKEGAK